MSPTNKKKERFMMGMGMGCSGEYHYVQTVDGPVRCCSRRNEEMSVLRRHDDIDYDVKDPKVPPGGRTQRHHNQIQKLNKRKRY